MTPIMLKNVAVLFIVAQICLVNALTEGGDCRVENSVGTCINIRNCSSAIEGLRNRKPPQLCVFDRSEPIVCCLDDVPLPSAATTTPAVSPATTMRISTTTEYIPEEEDYELVRGSLPTTCKPLGPDQTTAKTGAKAWDKCIEYQEKYVYPCVTGVSLSQGKVRDNRCGHSADGLVVGGENAKQGEFPHMALLGYGTDVAAAMWLCGGTIISEKFILTAGHCTYSRDYGAVTFVRIGVYKRTEQIDVSRLYAVSAIHKHPEYKPPIKYNDIALLETATEMALDRYTVPACVTGVSQAGDRASATGWGATKYRGDNAEILQKVVLTKFSADECRTKFPSTRLMKKGVDEVTQICFGDKTKSKDTCQGDSGGPLQVKNKLVECMYIVVGVTSFGKACGFVGDPGLYTSVQPYVPWIESLAWP